MSIRLSLVKEIEAFGQSLTVTTVQGSRKIKGILVPLLYKNKMYISGKQLPEGYFDSGHYMLICLPEAKIPISGIAVFESKTKRYVLKRSETVDYMDKPLYIWAVLEPYHGEREDDFEA